MATIAETIHKLQTLRPPNLEDHSAACATFNWNQARRALDASLEGNTGFNMATLAVDRHAHSPHAAKLALRWLGKTGARRDLTYAELANLCSRFAHVLRSLHVNAGDHLFLLCGRLPELYVALLGALKHQCVVTPLFSAFGPEPIATRLTLGHGRVLVTTASLYRRKVQALRESLPELKHVLLVTDDDGPLPPGTQDLRALLDAASPSYQPLPTDAQAPALLRFTSGTTGKPKGAVPRMTAAVRPLP
jgi:acetyl-CoA synthetase